ncbi:MAG: 16S rRNA (guanine(527)-N(7))-methyltransferase RsmG [Clostridia bacterium]|nr:16S rRNA (guanine(527)-N(7))-methyltransferase RsmG [Clostridia bacterium]
MEKIFEKNGIKLNKEKLEKFEKYYSLLVDYNQKFNITAITEREEIIVKHFVDSILNVDKLKGKLLDVGSGGGFPALPLKIVNENLSVSLVESTGKKCEFLREVVKNLCLENVDIFCERAEELSRKEGFRESYDFVSARAVARLNTLCEYCIPFVKVGGKFIAFKGDYNEELKEAENAIKVLGGEIEKVEEFTLAGAKRGIIYIKKIKNTPEKYPRGRGKERKCPL